MPGIVGLITRRPRACAEAELAQMVNALSHEDFYVTGKWSEESLGVYVGWAAQQGSFSDGMPLRNERLGAVLVFSGEEFPEPGMAQRLKEQGYGCDSHGPSYLVHLYEKDPSFPAGLNGRFQGLVADRSRETAILFNDRYGMHRLYYHRSKDSFYFAAEAKAILAARPELRTMDPTSLGEFVACGAVLDNRTLFEGIHLLPPASAWVFRKGALQRETSYFHPREWEEQDALDPQDYYKELRDVFTRNLPRYFSGPQRIAMSLTGGLDTRMIMAWRKPEPGSLSCYTFGGMRRDSQDIIVARQVAAVCGQSHEVIRLRGEVLERFHSYVDRAIYLTDGCLDVRHAPDLYLNERAREIAPVRMTGLYGGEILRRVRAFKPEEPRAGLFQPEFQSYVRRAAETYERLLQGHPVTCAAFKQAPWYHYGPLAVEQSQVSVRTPFLDNDLVRTVFRAPMSALATSEVSLKLIADGNRDLVGIRTDRGGVGNGLSEIASRALLGFLFKAEYAYDSGMPQWLAQLDHALSRLRLERLFLGRHKIFHFRIWYREVLAEYVKEVLLDPRSLSRPYIQPKGLEAVVQGHLRGDRNYTNEIHKALTLEVLQRLFLDDPGTGVSGGQIGVLASRSTIQ